MRVAGVCACALSIVASSCSWVFVETPSAHPSATEECTDTYAAPVTDTSGAVVSGLLGVGLEALAIQCASSRPGGDDSCSPSVNGDAKVFAGIGAVWLALAAVYVASAWHGYGAVHRCRALTR